MGGGRGSSERRASIFENGKVARWRRQEDIESLWGQTWNVFKARVLCHNKPLELIDPCLGKRTMGPSMPGVKTLDLSIFHSLMHNIGEMLTLKLKMLLTMPFLLDWGPLECSGMYVFIFLWMPALPRKLTLSQERERLISDHRAESPSPPLCCTIELRLWRGKGIESMLKFSPSEVNWRNANSKRYRIAPAAEIVGFTWQCILLIQSDCRLLNPFWVSRVYKQERRGSNFSYGMFSNRSNERAFLAS